MRANTRVAEAARSGVSRALDAAFRGGAVTGMLVVGLALIGVAGYYGILTFIGAYGPGIDKTGLTGEYDFTLAWDEENGPGLGAALSDQLGLRIVSQKVPISTLVVDSAQKPSAN